MKLYRKQAHSWNKVDIEEILPENINTLKNFKFSTFSNSLFTQINLLKEIHYSHFPKTYGYTSESVVFVYVFS